MAHKRVIYEDSFTSESTDEQQVEGDYSAWEYKLEQEEPKWFEATVRVSGRTLKEAAEMVAAAAENMIEITPDNTLTAGA